jgi:hypothetical protein
MKENGLSGAIEVDVFVCTVWSEATLDEMQLVYHEWMEHLECISDHDGEWVIE